MRKVLSPPSKDAVAASTEKFGVGNDPLEHEMTLKAIEPRQQDALERMGQLMEQYARASNNADIIKGVALWKVQIAQGSFADTVKYEFVRRFYYWLIGRGTKEDVAKTPWGRGNAAKWNGEVRAYIEAFGRKRVEWALKLMMLQTRYPSTLLEYYLFFKYIVNGKLQRVKKDADEWFTIGDDDFLHDFEMFETAFGDKSQSVYRGTNARDIQPQNEQESYKWRNTNQMRDPRDANETLYAVDGVEQQTAVAGQPAKDRAAVAPPSDSTLRAMDLGADVTVSEGAVLYGPEATNAAVNKAYEELMREMEQQKQTMTAKERDERAAQIAQNVEAATQPLKRLLAEQEKRIKELSKEAKRVRKLAATNPSAVHAAATVTAEELTEHRARMRQLENATAEGFLKANETTAALAAETKKLQSMQKELQQALGSVGPALTQVNQALAQQRGRETFAQSNGDVAQALEALRKQHADEMQRVRDVATANAEKIAQTKQKLQEEAQKQVAQKQKELQELAQAEVAQKTKELEEAARSKATELSKKLEELQNAAKKQEQHAVSEKVAEAAKKTQEEAALLKAENERLQEEKAKLEEERKKLHEAAENQAKLHKVLLQQAQTEAAQEKQRRAEAEARNVVGQSELDRARAHMNQLEAQLSQARAAGSQNVNALQAELATVKARFKQLGDTAHELRQKMELERTEHTIEQGKLRGENQALQAQVQSANELRNENQQLRARIEKAQADVNAANTEYAQMRETNTHEARNAQSALAALNAKLENLQQIAQQQQQAFTENANLLRAKVEKYRARMVKARMESGQEINELRSKMSARDKELRAAKQAEAEAAAAAFEHALEINDLEDAVQQAGNLEEAVDDYEELAAEKPSKTTTLEEAIDALEEEKDSTIARHYVQVHKEAKKAVGKMAGSKRAATELTQEADEEESTFDELAAHQSAKARVVVNEAVAEAAAEQRVVKEAVDKERRERRDMGRRVQNTVQELLKFAKQIDSIRMAVQDEPNEAAALKQYTFALDQFTKSKGVDKKVVETIRHNFGPMELEKALGSKKTIAELLQFAGESVQKGVRNIMNAGII